MNLPKYRIRVKYQNDNFILETCGDIELTTDLVEETFFYQKSINAFKLLEADYDYIKSIEESAATCDQISLELERYCQGSWSFDSKHKFSIQDCSFIDSKCEVTINSSPDDNGSCLLENKDAEIDIVKNFQSEFFDLITMTDFLGADSINYGNGSVFIYNSPIFNDILIKPVDDGSGGFTLDPTVDDLMATQSIGESERDLIRITKIGVISGPGVLDPEYKVFVAWAYRTSAAKVGAGLCPVTPPGYTLINDTGPSCIYQKKPTDSDPFFDFTSSNLSLGTCTLSSGETEIYSGDGGGLDYPGGFCYYIEDKDTLQFGSIKLENLLQIFNDRCGINQTVSDFFQINPENVSSTNYVTGATTKVNDIRFTPRSSMILYKSLFPSTGKMSFGELMKFLNNSFNVYWSFDSNGNFRLEHYKFYETVLTGQDLTSGDYAEFIKDEINYGYKKDQIPFLERFNQSVWLNYDFDERRISYVDSNGDKLNCVGTSQVEKSLGNFNTDLEFFIESPTEIDRSGWIVTACTFNAGANIGEVIYEDNHLNGHLSIKNLIDNYHYYGRFALEGDVENDHGVDAHVIFLSKIRVIEQDEFGLLICCDDDIDPNFLIKTFLGTGRIISITENLKTSNKTFKIEY